MYCELDSRTSNSTSRQNISPAKKTPNLRPGHRPDGALAFDPVRARRLRMMIECVLTLGLVLPRVCLPRAVGESFPLMHPLRGGADVAFARQVAMYLAHVGCALSLTEAARVYGRERTTAAHACKVVEERRDDPLFDRVIELLECCVRLGFRQIEPGLAESRHQSALEKS